VQGDAAQGSTVQRKAARCSARQHGAAQGSMVQRKAAPSSIWQHRAAFGSIVQLLQHLAASLVGWGVLPGVNPLLEVLFACLKECCTLDGVLMHVDRSNSDDPRVS